MKRLLRFVRTTLAGGLLFLVPIVVLAVIIGKALSITIKLVKPVADSIPVTSVIGLRTDWFLAAAVILLFCFLAGCFARTAPAKKIVSWIESKLLSNIPAYEYLKHMSESALEGDKARHWEVVLARTDDSLRLAFLVERLDNGLVAVFMPDAPNPSSGEVHLMTPDRITAVGAAPSGAVKCLKRLGLGSNSLLGAMHPQTP
jgi:uncharacterized membrane protein